MSSVGGEKRKDTTYEKLLRNYIFVPIAVETFGFWQLVTKEVTLWILIKQLLKIHSQNL